MMHPTPRGDPLLAENSDVYANACADVSHKPEATCQSMIRLRIKLVSEQVTKLLLQLITRWHPNQVKHPQ